MQLDEKNFPSEVLAVTLFAFSLLNISAQRFLEWLPEFIPTEMGIAFLTLAIPYTIKYILSEQENLARLISQSIDATGEFSEQLKPNRMDWIQFILLGFAIAILGLITVQPKVFGLPWTIPLLNILFQIWLFIFLLGFGIVVCLYLFNLNSIIKIDKIFICDGSHRKIFAWPVSEVRLLYSSYLRLVILAVFLYVGGIVSLWLTPAAAFLALQTNIGRLWVAPPALVILVYFLIFSLKIRSFLPRWKLNAINKINTILEKESAKYFEEPSNQKTEHIDRLLSWRRLIQSEDIKVFEWKQILTIVGIILAPTIRVLFFPVIKEAIRGLVS